MPEGYVGGGPVIGSDDGDIAFWGNVTQVDTDPCLGGKHVWAGTSVHDLVAALVAQRHMKTSPPVPVTIGGYHGVYLMLTAPADLDRCRAGSVTILTAGGTWLQWDVPNATFHEWILNVRGTRVVGGARVDPDAANAGRAHPHGRVRHVHRRGPAVVDVTIGYANRTWLASLVAVVVASLTACGGSPPPSLEGTTVPAAAAAGEVVLDEDGGPTGTRGRRGTRGRLGSSPSRSPGTSTSSCTSPRCSSTPTARSGRSPRALAGADLTMVNLETSISHRGAPEAKELEVPDNRYYFRTSPAALDVLAAAGVDVATMANNHGADYGPLGLQDTLAGAPAQPGPRRRHRREPAGGLHAVPRLDPRHHVRRSSGQTHRSAKERAPSGPPVRRRPGSPRPTPRDPACCSTRCARPAAQGDVVVVYLHWGEELPGCPTAKQRITARALAEAGADIVVGSHAHVLLGSGWMGDTYVDYGLGNFLWYHNHQPESGVLQLRVRDGTVVGDALAPARIGTYGRPRPPRSAGHAPRRLPTGAGCGPAPVSRPDARELKPRPRASVRDSAVCHLDAHVPVRSSRACAKLATC